MRFFSMGAVWGVVVILCGLSILFKAIFNINIPIFRIIIGIAVIGWGISILIGFRFHHNGNKGMFGDIRFNTDSVRREYNVLFGTGLVDLSNFEAAALPQKIKVNSVFADTLVLVKQDSDVRIQANSAFGNAVLPGGDNVVFGSINHPSGTADKPHLEVNVVFGQIRVEYR